MKDKNAYDRPELGAGIDSHVEYPTGHVHIIAENKDTGEVKELKVHNLVVDNMRSQQAHLMGGDNVDDRYIDRVGFGTDGTAPDPSDTVLENPEMVDVSEVEYDDRQVQFTAVLPDDEGNGVTFQEAGLIFRNTSPYLGARVTFEPMEKSSAWTWTIRWTISW